MVRGVQSFVVAVAAAGLLSGAAGGGSYFPPPGDGAPVWSPDASVIVYARQREPRGLYVIRPDGSDDHPLPGFNPYLPFAFSRDWFWIAFTDTDPSLPSATALVVSRPDGSRRRVLAESDGGRPSWSPDGTRLAFARPEPNDPQDLYTVGLDGGAPTQIAEDAFSPVWSPDGTRIAYVAMRSPGGRWDIAVVNADGSGRIDVTGAIPGEAFSTPAWSPDDSRLAFVGRGFIGVISPDGTGLRRFPARGYAGQLRWSPDGEELLYSGAGPMMPSAGTGVFVLDVATGRHRVIAPFGNAAEWSPDGAQIAFAGGGECKDRAGVYRVRADGSGRERLTNDCRILGTAGADELPGTELADVLVGLGGDDRLNANDGNYMGDDLYGGDGEDVLVGDFLGDVLDGGLGADRLDGRPGPDAIRGGPGRDALAGAGGRDVILAEDGERDTVSCGTNSPSGGPDLDTAFLDRLDRVTPDCELLYRAGRADLTRGRTALTITVRPRRWTLRCNPAGGTLPRAATACARLASMRGPLAPLPPGRLCAASIEPFRSASVRGTFAGRSVSVLFTRYNSCEQQRWNRHRFLLEPR